MDLKIKNCETFKQRNFAVQAIHSFERRYPDKKGRRSSVVYSFTDSWRNRTLRYLVYRTETMVIADLFKIDDLNYE